MKRRVGYLILVMMAVVFFALPSMVSAGEIDDSSSEKSAAVQEKGAEIAYYTPQIVSVYNCDKGMKIRWNNNVRRWQ